MPALLRNRKRVALNSLVVAIGVAIGCNGENSTAPETSTGAAKPEAGAGQSARALQDIEKDLKPPVVIKPGPSPDTGAATTKP